jgi:hypothetical protein
VQELCKFVQLLARCTKCPEGMSLCKCNSPLGVARCTKFKGTPLPTNDGIQNNDQSSSTFGPIRGSPRDDDLIRMCCRGRR